MLARRTLLTGAGADLTVGALAATGSVFWTEPVPAVEYPDDHPAHVNPDRKASGGYSQVIWETVLPRRR